MLTCSSPSAKVTNRMGAAQSWSQSKGKACNGSLADLGRYLCCHSLCGTMCNSRQTETPNCCRRPTGYSRASWDRPPEGFCWLWQKGHHRNTHGSSPCHTSGRMFILHLLELPRGLLAWTLQSTFHPIPSQ